MTIIRLQFTVFKEEASSVNNKSGSEVKWIQIKMGEFLGDIK